MESEFANIKIGQPAYRALQAAGVETLDQLAKYTEDELLALHGFGPKALGMLKTMLSQKGLSFKVTQKGEIIEEKKDKSINEYILNFPPETQEILETLRKVINESAPDAEEKISWQMPTFVLHGNLVHFAAFKNHIGLYPAPSGIVAFEQELSEYKQGKGSVQFPLNKPLPFELISKIVKFRVDENKKQAEDKLKKKK